MNIKQELAMCAAKAVIGTAFAFATKVILVKALKSAEAEAKAKTKS